MTFQFYDIDNQPTPEFEAILGEVTDEMIPIIEGLALKGLSFSEIDKVIMTCRIKAMIKHKAAKQDI